MADDLRKYAKKNNTQLIIGAFVLLFVVGLGLIALIYGLNAALMGLLCLLAMLVPIGLVALVMFGLNLLVKRINKQ